MDGPNLVAPTVGPGYCTHTSTPTYSGYIISSTQPWIYSPNENFELGSNETVYVQTAAMQLSAAAEQTISKARASSTQQQYKAHVDRWVLYTSQMGENTHNPSSINVVINFLQFCKDHFHWGYSSVNTAKSAIQNMVTVQGRNISEFKILQDFMKGVLRENPVAPRYSHIWDPQSVLTHVSQWGLPHSLSLKLLVQKLLILLLLCSGHRLQTVFNFTVDCLDFTVDGFQFTIRKVLKKKTSATVVHYKSFPQSPSLCPKLHLIEYLHRSAQHRTSPQLFLSYQQPFQAVTQSTLSRWVTQVLASSGIDVGIFKPHSTRAASTSGAARGGATIDTILSAAGWSSQSTFTSWYNKPVNNGNFQQAMFRGSNFNV